MRVFGNENSIAPDLGTQLCGKSPVPAGLSSRWPSLLFLGS